MTIALTFRSNSKTHIKMEEQITVEEILSGSPLTYPQHESFAIHEILSNKKKLPKLAAMGLNNKDILNRIFNGIKNHNHHMYKFLKDYPNYPFSEKQYNELFKTSLKWKNVDSIKLIKLNILAMPKNYREKLFNQLLTEYSYGRLLEPYFNHINTTQQERDAYLQFILKPPTYAAYGRQHLLHKVTHSQLAANYMKHFPDDSHRGELFKIAISNKPLPLLHLSKSNFAFTQSEKEQLLTVVVKHTRYFVQHKQAIENLFNTKSEFKDYFINLKSKVFDRLVEKDLKPIIRDRETTLELIKKINNNNLEELITDMAKSHFTHPDDILIYTAKMKTQTIDHIVRNESIDLLLQIKIEEHYMEHIFKKLKGNRKQYGSDFINNFIKLIETSMLPKEKMEKMRAELIMKLLTNM